MNSSLTILLTTIAASSVIATLFSQAFTWYFKRVDFKYSYTKHILEKRIEAYNAIEQLFKSLFLRRHKIIVGNDGDSRQVLIYIYHAIFDFSEKNSKYYIFYEELEKVINKGFWYSDEMINNLTKLKRALDKITIELTPDSETMDFIRTGNMHADLIKNIYSEIKNQYLIDLKKLDEIKSFRSRKRIMYPHQHDSKKFSR